MEINYIEQYKSNDRNYGYNLTDGGDGLSGYKHSDESRQKISISLKGKIPWNRGITLSDETKLKQSLSHLNHPGYWKDRKLSKSHVDNLSKSHMGLQSGESHPMYGKHHTEESKNKISKSLSGKTKESKISESDRIRIINLRKNNNMTYDQLAKMFGVGRTTIFRVIKENK
jgi:group I intron endonuclease